MHEQAEGPKKGSVTFFRPLPFLGLSVVVTTGYLDDDPGLLPLAMSLS